MGVWKENVVVRKCAFMGQLLILKAVRPRASVFTQGAGALPLDFADVTVRDWSVVRFSQELPRLYAC